MSDYLIPSSSTYPMVLSEYSLKRLKGVRASTGETINVRVGSLKVITNPSDASIRRCTATFMYTNNEGESHPMMFSSKNPKVENELNLSFDIDSRTVDTFATVLKALNVVALYLDTGKKICAKSSPRRTRYISYRNKYNTHTNSVEADIYHEVLYTCAGFNDNIIKKRECVKFKSGAVEYTVDQPYAPYNAWINRACKDFCKRHIDNSVFIKQTPNKV